MPARSLLLAFLSLLIPPAHAQTLITEPGAGVAPIQKLLSSAKHSIDMTMYELVDADTQQILIDQAARGVQVRVILDQNLERHNNTATFTQLSTAGVHVVWANPVYAATHQKTVTVDSKTSAILTLNLTSRYYATSRDFALIETTPKDVAAILKTFNADFIAAAITPPLGSHLVWSPTNASAALVKLIRSAQKTLDVENEEMAAPDIVAALTAAAKRGVTVKVTMTLNPAYTSEFTTLTAAGVHIRTYAQTAPLYIHAKVILADAALPTRKAFLGSENFSNASLTRNRELGLILTQRAVVQSLATTLAADFAGATPWTPAASLESAPTPIRPPS